MVLYIAFISTLNLCLGYVLGVYVGKLPSLMWLPRRREPTNYGKVAAAALAPVEQAQTSSQHATKEATSKKVKNANIQSGPIDPPEAQAEESLPEEHVDIDDFVEGLANFQAQLTEVDKKLHSGKVDKESTEHCVDQLENASEDYLQCANEACDKLTPMADDTERIVEEKLQVKQTILEQSEIVKDQKVKCCDVDSSDADKATKELLESSDALSDAAKVLQEQLSEIFASTDSEANSTSDENISATKKSQDAGTDTTSKTTHRIDRDAARQRVDDFYQVADQANQLVAAFVELDNIDSSHGEFVERLLAALTDMVDADLSDQHTATEYAEGQLLLLLNGETVESAMQVVEQVRQQVEASQFSADGKPCDATVSCALIDAHNATDRMVLESQLSEALGEARRYGNNRTFCHDGTIASPVVSLDLALQSQKRTI